MENETYRNEKAALHMLLVRTRKASNNNNSIFNCQSVQASRNSVKIYGSLLLVEVLSAEGGGLCALWQP